WSGLPGRCEMYCAGLDDGDWLSICDCFEAERCLARPEAANQRKVKVELQPKFVISVVLDGDDSPQEQPANVQRLLELALVAMVDAGAIRAFAPVEVRP